MLRMRPWFAAVTLGLGGCSLPAQRADFRSPDPQERTLAIARAARTQDPTSVPALISQLESEDPADRMFAIRALERTTGQTLDYRYDDPEPARREAVDRWVRWVAERPDPLATPESPAPEADLRTSQGLD
ncbi:MAG: HEAT repeat domain-containing protein [Planctomycetota bacterium]|nr:HEAT repeat domain-containing protein [Planctomycetota bacterium]